MEDNRLELQKKNLIIESTELSVSQLLSQFPDFKAWIENTQLFNAIVEGTNMRWGGMTYELRTPLINLVLTNTVRITKPEELPIELLWEFYINSPWYVPIEEEDQTKKLNL